MYRASEARPLRRAMERGLVDPLSRLIAADNLTPADVVDVDPGETGIEFFRRSRSLEVAVV